VKQRKSHINTNSDASDSDKDSCTEDMS